MLHRECSLMKDRLWHNREPALQSHTVIFDHPRISENNYHTWYVRVLIYKAIAMQQCPKRVLSARPLIVILCPTTVYIFLDDAAQHDTALNWNSSPCWKERHKEGYLTTIVGQLPSLPNHQWISNGCNGEGKENLGLLTSTAAQNDGRESVAPSR